MNVTTVARARAISTRRPGWLLWLLVSVFTAAAAAGCKKDADEALVIVNVQVASGVSGIGAFSFSVDGRSDIPAKTTTDKTLIAQSSFKFGYYMPGVNGTVTIIGQALDGHGCLIGKGMVTAQNVVAGHTTPADGGAPLTLNIVSVMGGCGGGGTGGDSGRGGTGGRDAGGSSGSGAGGGNQGQTDGGTDGPVIKAALGVPCKSAGECASDHCVDGNCCESACTGSCEACGEAAMAGKCISVTGTPRTGHTACAGAGTPCVGTCDGATRATCTYPGTTQTCRAAGCTAATATLAATCDGAGACPPAQTVSCGANVCSGTICSGGCSDTAPCAGTVNYCAGGVCIAKKATGQKCSGASECVSGFCADGYCCNTACTGSCQACNLTASPGTCGAVKSAIDDTCSGMQTCDATGACKKANGQTCTAAADCTSGSCVDGHCCGTASCGACQSCTGGGGTCVAVTSADDPDACTGNNTCDANGACKAKQGQPCTSSTACVTGFCADGVCCNAACNGQCEACAETAGKGTCAAVSGTPRSGHAACAGAGTTCGGTCDGTNRTSCAFAGASTTCRVGSCTGGTATLAASCDGKGACPAVQTMSCGANSCAGTICAGGCSSTQPCASNTFYCSAGACVPKKGNGTTCGAGAECTSGNCVDGVCCTSASCGTCQSCTGTGGTCVAVTNAEDPSTCSGTSSCDSTGACKVKQGQACTTNSQCSTGFCVDGVCCNNGCTGTCQYCGGGSATGVAAGVCGTVSGTPKRGSCAGTGTCQGTCNGQATCTMPGSSVSCGSATCNTTTNMSTAVGACDGAGNCKAGTTSGCSPFLCGGNACLMACSGTGANQCVSGAACIGGACQTCSGGKTACGNVCADLNSDPNHCGTCMMNCGGSTPLCVNKKCSQCATVADCSSGYQACCAANDSRCTANTCVCALKSGNNIVPNGGFDTDLSGWTALAGQAAWNRSDANSCLASGSADVSSDEIVSTCFPGAQPNKLYNFGFKYFDTAGSGAYCNVLTASVSDCTDGMGNFSASGSVLNAWATASTTFTAPASTVAFKISCIGSAKIDQMYLNAVDASF